jgi:MoaA/NifB/PqqE/SkfB family radical SAM enzyme
MLWDSLLRTGLSHVILHVTDRCNLQCKTCFVQKGTTDLALDQARIIAQKLGRFRWLDIGGGEPFLHPDLVAICGLFRCESITIPTNGQCSGLVAGTTHRLMQTVSAPVTLAVSLDGPAEVNDAIRGPGSFENALATFDRLEALPGLTLKINTVVSNKNVHQLVDFVRYVRGLSPAYHSLLLLRGAPASEELTLPDLALLRQITPEILDTLRTYDFAVGRRPVRRYLATNYQRYLWNISLKTLERHECFVPCQAPRCHKVIYPDGAVGMCELMPPVGNILTEPLRVLEDRMRQALRRHELEQGPCYCTHNCNLGENIMTHPRSVFRILTGRCDG